MKLQVQCSAECALIHCNIAGGGAVLQCGGGGEDSCTRILRHWRYWRYWRYCVSTLETVRQAAVELMAGFWIIPLVIWY